MSEDNAVLGKRKQREDNEAHPAGSTLFVSNLPYTATSIDLQTLFSDLGPVRSAFVVLEGEASKGVGYVSFAIKDDAATAMEAIEKDGISLDGRKLRVQLADRKPKDKADTSNVKPERKTPATPRQTHPKSAKDPNAIRTIAISGLPLSVDQKTLWKKVRKCDGAESTELVPGESGAAHVLFSSPAAAARAVEKLHAHVFKGAILSVTLKKRLETLSKGPARKDGANSISAPNNASRLIVRNVPWNITEKDLRALFLPYGPVYSTTIPKEKPGADGTENKKPRARGFAFVWFFSKKDAEQAIAGVNGRAVMAGAIGAPTMNKKERSRLRRQLREEAKEKAEAEGQNEEDEEASGDEDGDEDEELQNELTDAQKAGVRILAVDWALSKEKWEEAKSKGVDEGAKEGEGEGSGSESESDEDENEHENDTEGSVSGMDVDDDRSDVDQAVKPTLPQTDVGTTLFVRNVPFDATEDELRVLFRAFGPLRYVRITMDAETGRSRGTAFVCFWNKEDADKAVHQSELLGREAGLDVPKKNPFALPSLLTPDPSSSLAQALVLHGRTLSVACAVPRDAAARLKDEGERQREKADKRNMYLLREGVILPGTPAAAVLSAAELEKRNASFGARRALLKSNPALFVSRTRLSIRQLPMTTTERSLKRLGVYAVREFEKEVKRGERQPLTEDELREVAADDEAVDGEEKDKKKSRGKKGERETGVRQAKVVRQSERVDTLTGKGKSRGYGFLEMKQHSDALRVLRWANNNPDVGQLLEEWWKAEVEDLIKTLGAAAKKPKVKEGDEESEEDVETRIKRLKKELEHLKSGEGRKSAKTLIIEFSIENAQVVNRRREKMETAKSPSTSSRSRPTGRGENVSDDHDGAKPSKRRKVDEDTPTKKAPALRQKREGPIGNDPPKSSSGLGSLIGRKRKMRKTRGKA
ncbi:hypothetical protein M0805_009440 [Coniferiporia weirii]|nr:hypothetical protein M0805_009440 [Coniferiporia weirii]